MRLRVLAKYNWKTIFCGYYMSILTHVQGHLVKYWNRNNSSIVDFARVQIIFWYRVSSHHMRYAANVQGQRSRSQGQARSVKWCISSKNATGLIRQYGNGYWIGSATSNLAGKDWRGVARAVSSCIAFTIATFSSYSYPVCIITTFESLLGL